MPNAFRLTVLIGEAAEQTMWQESPLRASPHVPGDEPGGVDKDRINQAGENITRPCDGPIGSERSFLLVTKAKMW